MKGDFWGPMDFRGVLLFERTKSNQKCAGPAWLRTSCKSSRFLVGLRHTCPFDWQFGNGFRWRPLFFIREKKRRFSASMPQMSGAFVGVCLVSHFKLHTSNFLMATAVFHPRKEAALSASLPQMSGVFVGVC